MLHLSVSGTLYTAGEGNTDTVQLEFPTQKARALFVYLGLTRGQQHSRRELGALLWPDAAEAQAHSNLRQTVHRIRGLLHEHGVAPAVIVSSAQHLALSAHPDVEVDSLSLQHVWRQCQQHAHRDIAHCTICARRLAQVAHLIAPPLAGLRVDDSPDLDLWLHSQREQIMDVARRILHTLAVFHTRGAEWEAALAYARQWLALEPWQEEAHALAIRALAAQGQRETALQQFQRCRQVLQCEFGVAPTAELEQLHRQVAAGLLLQPAPPRFHNAPPRGDRLFGRQPELSALEEMLNDPANRLITVLGVAGAGKTQLALAAARSASRLFRDGGCLVGLDSIQDETQLVAALAHVLGVAPVVGHSPEATLMGALAKRNQLLVLDGAEQLGSAAPLLARLLHHCPGITLLVTSRVRLSLHAERILLLEGLPVPQSMAKRMPDADDSIAHFVHAAQRLSPAFALTPDNAATIQRICRTLGGLPLAVELAAAQTATCSCRQILRRLPHNLSILSAPWIDLPPRQRSLRASLSASWRRLPSPLQRLLGALACLDGAFTLAEAASCVEGRRITTAADGKLKADLQFLVDHCLLRQVAPGSYSLHATVRLFAAEQQEQQHRRRLTGRRQGPQMKVAEDPSLSSVFEWERNGRIHWDEDIDGTRAPPTAC